MIQSSTAANTASFQFTGKGSEYFRIWIVNLSLTIVTLGIYSAWAKVRKKRYFYGNTLLEGSSFEYLANPLAILKGRVIAFLIFAVYLLCEEFFPASSIFFIIVFIFALPWLVVKSLAFNARYSAYRGLRFNFNGGYKDAIRVFVGIAALIPLTLGLIYPYYEARQKKFIVNHHSYGNANFGFEGNVSAFYKIYLKALLLLILSALTIAVLSYLLHKMVGAPSAVVLPFFFYFLFLGVLAYAKTAVTNLTWNNTYIIGNRFTCTLRAKTIIWLYFTNFLAIVCSLGLLIPWAAIRMAHYRITQLSLTGEEPLDVFVARAQGDMNAVGSEMSDVLDVEFAI